MNSVRTGTFRSSLLVAIASWVVNGHAWAQTTPSPVIPPATPQPAAEGGGAAIAAGSGNSDRSLSGNSGRSKQALRSRSTRAKRPPNASPGRGRSDRSHDPA